MPKVFDTLPTQPEGGILVGRLHPASKAPVMRAQLETRDGALVLDVPLPATTAGRELAVEVRNKTLPMASIEFCALSDRMVRGVRRISQSVVSAVALGAARVLLQRDRRSQTPAAAPGAVVADARHTRARHVNRSDGRGGGNRRSVCARRARECSACGRCPGLRSGISIFQPTGF